MQTLSRPSLQATAIAPVRTSVRRDAEDAASRSGASFTTNEQFGGIELVGELARGVHEYLRINYLLGPVIEIPGAELREIHLVAGLAKAELAISWLTEIGVTVHRNGAAIPLPTTDTLSDSARWSSDPELALPAVVAIAAAVRAIRARNASTNGTARSAS